ncbi:MAG TPA: MinD/ParA family protein [Nitrospiraceae bacterium]|nr:MinD/ParA family protein [Nitrospiraceae bacterium]
MSNFTLATQPGEIQAGTGFRPPRVITVTSGKGGVGKTNVVANLAIALARVGKRVLVLDADLGLGNIDVLLGLVPKWTLEHVLSGARSLSDIMLQGPSGIRILPASSGMPQLTALTEAQQVVLQAELDQISHMFDVLLIDTGAGISSNVTFFAAAAQAIVVVVSPEPTSLTDAYALMKVLLRQYRERRFHVLVNLAKSPNEGARVFSKLEVAVSRFLQVSIDYLGAVPLDDYLPLAVTQQRAVLDRYPQAPSSRAFMSLTETVDRLAVPDLPKGTVQFLWQHLLRTV